MNAITHSERKRIAGIDSGLFWGYVATMIFMVGDGLEQGWLSPYLVQHGLTVQQSSMLFTVYGATLAVASWFSGVLAEAWGPRRVMTLGVLIWLIGEVLFILFGMEHQNYAVMLPTYAIRGFGYPLFCYSFLVWVTYRSAGKGLGTAVGWFWFALSGGLYVIGNYYSAYMIPIIGNIGTMWTAVIWVLIGGLIGIFLVKGNVSEYMGNSKEKLKTLKSGLTICYENPKVALGGIVRIINNTGIGGIPVFYPVYLSTHFGFTTTQWLQIWGTFWFVNIAFSVISGYISDKILGWRNTVMWVGSVGCGIMTLVLFYTPKAFGHSFLMVDLAAMLFGAVLSGYVPLTALISSLTPENKGASMSVVNFGAGFSYFIGPAIVGIFIGPIGAGGVVWIFAILYFISAVIMAFIKLPENHSALKQV
ncbi:MFS transporter [Alicyclobacillus fastidiosus]|uniref:MFS transporter n=1 Tax=Alicyclobacillus fastidiosus TaxID=392011 RepID=A0ABY6ZNF2_9BACL|nr:MFS transporter [Alicyclobacillus fastidiosus]WAH44505.1 MFS transporter [Alicyclobacillus fastidiosus]